jgi:hypothetical protein
MGPAMAVTVVCAVIGAVGTVLGAWIQARGQRPREEQTRPSDASGDGLHPSGIHPNGQQ